MLSRENIKYDLSSSYIRYRFGMLSLYPLNNIISQYSPFVSVAKCICHHAHMRFILILRLSLAIYSNYFARNIK